jgi:hypothetical protein
MTENFDESDVPAVALILLHGILSSGSVKPNSMDLDETHLKLVATAFCMAERFIESAAEHKAT